MGHSEESLYDLNVKINVDSAGLTHEVSGEKRDIVENSPRGQLCCIAHNKLAAFCLCPGNWVGFLK